jgi:hypothetical protein
MRARGLTLGFWTVTLAALWAGGVACGGSDGDDAGDPADAGEDGSGGSRGGSQNNSEGGEPGESGGTGATGATGSGATGATGSGATGGSGSGGSSTGKGGSVGSMAGNSADLLDEIGEACEVDCDAQFAVECAPQNSNTLTCQLSCAASTAQVGDFCLAEYRDYVECRGAGGYDCVNDYPYQRSTCAAQQAAFTACSQHIGCKRYCKKAIDEGCIDDDLESCIESCIEDDEGLPEGCSYYHESIAYCQATSQTVCIENGLSTPAACSYQVLSVAECVSDESDDLCAGWCWAANKLGCGGEDCAAECAEKSTDATCGQAFVELLDCGLFFGDAACETDAFNANGICASEVEQYQTCLEGMSETQ